MSVLITDNREMRSLNRRFRKVNRPTDVLSFASYAGQSEAGGDLAISCEIAKLNARRYKHSLETEIKVLILHGALHLAGMDHENDDGEMARCERKFRSRFRLPLTLIERTERHR